MMNRGQQILLGGMRAHHRRSARVHILIAKADHPGGIAHGDRIVGDRPGDDRAGADHAVMADISQDDRAVADPGVTADRRPRPGPRLLPDRHVEPVDPVLRAAVDHRDVRAEQHVVLERDVAQAAAGDHYRAWLMMSLVEDLGRLMELWKSVVMTASPSLPRLAQAIWSTHVTRARPVVGTNGGAAVIVTMDLVAPVSCGAEPFSLAAQVVLTTVPALPFPDESYRVPPVPSLEGKAATSLLVAVLEAVTAAGD